MLLGQNFGRCHERDLQVVLHRHDGREERHDRLPGSDVALQQPVHRLRALHVLDDVLQRLSLTAGQLERQHAPRRLANAVVHLHRLRLPLGGRRPPARDEPDLEQKRLFEDQPVLRGRRKAIQQIERRILRRKMRGQERGVSRGQVQPQPDLVRQRIRQIGGHELQRIVHQAPLHLRRHRARSLVHRHDAAGVNRLPLFVVQDFVLRIRELQAGRAAHFDRAEQDHVLSAREDVAQKRLVQPRRAQRPAAIVDRGLEDLETGSSRRAKAARQDAPRDGGNLSRTQRGDRLQAAAIFVANRKAIEEIFDGGQAGAFEIRGASRPDTLEELQRGRQYLVGQCYWTMMACPRSTRISRIFAGSSKGSSMLMPAGFSFVFE